MPTWAWPLLALPLVAAVGFWTYRTVAAELHRSVAAALQTMVEANATALDVWLRDQANLAAVMAADPRVRLEIAELLALSARTGGEAAALRGAPAQGRLREVMAPVVSRQHNAGCFVLDRGGLIVARIVDERIGDRVVPTVAEAAARALEGRAVFLPASLKQRF